MSGFSQWNRFCRYIKRGDRWLALVAGMWIMACAGSSYTFAIYSPVLKSTLGYNQVEIDSLAVAKDVGESVGLLAGMMCDLLPPWALLFIGAIHNLVGFGTLWLVLTGRIGPLPYWQMCAILVVGAQGTSYLNTANLVTSVRNFPKHRGTVVGVLKGLVGLSGAIFTQMYTALLSPDQKGFLLLVAVMPLIVTVSTMFFVRPVSSDARKESEDEEGCILNVIIALNFLLAAYLLAAMLAQDLLPLSDQVSKVMAGVMVGIFTLPLAAPIGSRLLARRKRQIAAITGSDPFPVAQEGIFLSTPLLGQDSVRVESLASYRTVGPITTGQLAEQGTGTDNFGALTGPREGRTGEGVPGVSAAQHGEEISDQDVLSIENNGQSIPTNQEAVSPGPVFNGPLRPPKPPLPPSARSTGKSLSTPRSNPSSAAQHPRASNTVSSSSGYFSDDLLSGDEEERANPTHLLGGLRSPFRRKESHLLQAVGQGAVRVKQRKGPRRGEDFTLAQAMVKADFWLLFFAVTCGCGSGLAAINNLAQMASAQGFPNVRIFVSMVSVWNFCGRVGAGFLSEHVVKDFALPRPCVLLAAQACMCVGHLLFALAAPGSLYVGSLIVGLGYGAHWAIMPATASELFGLRHFGMLYNTLTIANPLGSYLFSNLVAGQLYDLEAEREAQGGVTGGRYGGVGSGLTLAGGWSSLIGRLGWAWGLVTDLFNISPDNVQSVGIASGGTSRAGLSANLSSGGQVSANPGIFTQDGLLWFLNSTETVPGGQLRLVGSRQSHLSAALGGRSLLGFPDFQDTPTLVAASSIFPSSPGADCHGAHCFRLTFFIMMGVCLVGVILNGVLILRTKSVYYTLYGRQMEAKKGRAISETAATEEPNASS